MDVRQIVKMEEDLFEDAKTKLQLEQEKESNLKLPNSSHLFEGNSELDKILEKKSKTIEIIEVDDEEFYDANDKEDEVLRKVELVLGSKERNDKVKVLSFDAKSTDELNVDALKNDDISKYIGGEEETKENGLFD